MGFLDKAKAAAEQAANKANEAVGDVQTKRELTKAYGDLGEKTFGLADSGAISHPDIEADVTRIRELQAKLEEDEAAPTAADAAPAPAAEATAPSGGNGTA